MTALLDHAHIKRLIDANPVGELAHAKAADEAKLLRLLASHVKGLRYWSTGFDEDDKEAIYWREYHESWVDFYLAQIKERGF